ncbi:MAG: hypothetical protein WCF90_07545 [Methanomicrobiales archaeon]
MNASIFEILMAVGLGAIVGAGIGLLIGFGTKQQKSEWSAMTRKEQTINIVLILLFSAVCIAGIAWYMFTGSQTAL